MTVPLKGGRPCLVTNPHVAGKIVSLMANGSSQADAVRAVGVSASTVSRVARANAQTIDEMREAIQRKVAGKVLAGVDKATRARLKDAQDAKSRTGAQSYRALMEAAGTIGSASVHVGDNVAVDACSVEIDARRIAVLARDPEALRRRLAELNRQLGIE